MFNLKLTLFLLFLSSLMNGQNIDSKLYNETFNNGVIIQNSLPKGGPYLGPTVKHHNYSYLVFFTRLINKTKNSFELKMNFSADSIQIPNSPYTYMKLFLPNKKMTLDKINLFSYGITKLESLNKRTKFQKHIKPNEECLFYVVALFYQTIPEAKGQLRGGNRAELILKGKELFYSISPQVDALKCGQLVFNK